MFRDLIPSPCDATFSFFGLAFSVEVNVQLGNCLKRQTVVQLNHFLYQKVGTHYVGLNRCFGLEGGINKPGFELWIFSLVDECSITALPRACQTSALRIRSPIVLRIIAN